MAVVGAGQHHHPYAVQVPYNRVADGGNGANNNNNGNGNANNNLMGQQQALPAVGQPQQMVGFRLPATDNNDATNNSSANHSLEENKKYQVSVSFDR